MNSYEEQNRKFLNDLIQLCDDRGQAAALRRWWSPATVHHAYPPLGRLGAIDDWPRSTLSALYAEHNLHSGNGNSIGKAALLLGDRKNGEHPYERQFRRLISSRAKEDLAKQLHRLVKRLHNEGVALDYVALLTDLRMWRNHDEKVKVRWAMEFWNVPKELAP